MNEILTNVISENVEVKEQRKSMRRQLNILWRDFKILPIGKGDYFVCLE